MSGILNELFTEGGYNEVTGELWDGVRNEQTALSANENVTGNGWVTLDSGQHVFIGEDGSFNPGGPPASPTAESPEPAKELAYPELEKSTNTYTKGMDLLPQKDTEAVKAVPEAELATLEKAHAASPDSRYNFVKIATLAKSLGWSKSKLGHVLRAGIDRGRLSLRMTEGYGGLTEEDRSYLFAARAGDERYGNVVLTKGGSR